jgi:hypothetical protein
LPLKVAAELQTFLSLLPENAPDLKTLGIERIPLSTLIDRIRDAYGLVV